MSCKAPACPRIPASQQEPVSARLALCSVHTRTNLIWPEGGSGDWWFHHVSSATAIWPGTTTAAALFLGVYVTDIQVCEAVRTLKHRRWLSHKREAAKGSGCFACCLWWNLSRACDKLQLHSIPGLLKKAQNVNGFPSHPQVSSAVTVISSKMYLQCLHVKTRSLPTMLRLLLRYSFPSKWHLSYFFISRCVRKAKRQKGTLT